MGGNGAFSSLTQYAADPLVNLVVMALIIIGGIGFFVWSDLKTNKFRFRRYKLHTKVVLVTTAALIVIPFLFMLLTERNNPNFAGAPLTYLLSCLFQTVTTRTAGFNTADLTALSDATVLCMIFLMIIGGSPSSTAGGLKTTTLAMLVASLASIFKKRKNISCFRRRISDNVLLQIISITALYTLLFFGCAMLICAFDSISVKEALFETASAIGTVGLTLGITASLSTASHLVLMALMFFGRVGGLTILLAFHDQQSVTPSKYPVENITIG